VTPRIHPTALVERGAELGREVEIGPYAIIGAGAELGDGCRLGPHVVLEGTVRLGAGVILGAGAVLGSPPQDHKYRGEPTAVEIGPRTVIREYSTVNRATAASGRTVVGSDCLLMTYVHVAHDCVLGDGVTIANSTQLSGHITVEQGATLSGLIAVHQFVTIGTQAFVGGASRVNQDIPPYVKAVGNPVELVGLNGVGLTRAGFTAETIAALKRAYRLLFNSSLPRAEAIAQLRAEPVQLPEVHRLLDFVASARRGVPA
jgi:UDP-N-acetylglucosamine acyltransferase